MRMRYLGAIAGMALVGAVATQGGVAVADRSDVIQGDPWVLVDKRVNLKSAEGIAFSAPDSGWAVGTNYESDSMSPFAMRWDGKAWTEAKVGDFGSRPQQLNRVAVLDSGDAWATGAAGQLEQASGSPRPGSDLWYRNADGLRVDAVPRVHQAAEAIPYVLATWNGSEWTPKESPAPPEGKQAVVTDLKKVGGEIWAVGLEHHTGQASGQQAFVDRYQDGRWHRVQLPAELTSKPSALFSLTGKSADDVWLSGAFPTPEKDTPFVAHWDGTAFEVTELPVTSDFPNGWNADVVAVMADEVYVTGRSLYTDKSLTTAYRYDGTKWTEWTGLALVEVNDISVAPDESSMVLGGWPSMRTHNSQYASFDGTTWTSHEQPQELGVHDGQVLNLRHLPGTGRAMAVGYVNAPESGYSYITANE